MSDDLKILVVDDSSVYRTIVARCVAGIPNAMVVGKAGNGVEALEVMSKVKPDLVLLDLEMPVMDGMTALKVMRTLHPDVGVIMVTGIDLKAAERTMSALKAGAFDFIAKPSTKRGENGAAILEPLLRHSLEAYARSTGSVEPQQSRPAVPPPARRGQALPSFSAIGIGVSTGGPKTLAKLLPSFPANFPAPIFIVQHLPEGFSGSLVSGLEASCPCSVHEAADGDVPRGGHIYIAPGGQHMTLEGSRFSPVIRLNRDEPEHHCRPAVDVLFRSMPEVYGRNILSIVLTGMGFDGVKGVRVIREAGGYCIAQDAESSIVYGMPKAVVDAGEADEILSLDELAGRAIALVKRSAA